MRVGVRERTRTVWRRKQKKEQLPKILKSELIFLRTKIIENKNKKENLERGL